MCSRQVYLTALKRFDSLYYRRIGEESYGESARRKIIQGNIKQWIYSLQMGFTSSTRPAMDLDSGQISAGSSTSLNYYKVRRRLYPYTNNASDTDDSVYHHCYVVTRPTRVPCALTTIFVMAGRQGLRKTCTRLHKNKLAVIDMLPTAEPSVSIHYNWGLSNEGKKEAPFSVRGKFRKRKGCMLTSSAPIESWHSLRHSFRSLVARHKLAARR
jgi:hypothetical protein